MNNQSNINQSGPYDDNLLYRDRMCCVKRLCWSAVFAGALVGVGIAFLFNLFGLAIGLAAFAHTTASAKSIAVGGFIGLAIIAIFSMGTAGYVAGFLGRPKCLNHNLGVLYGFTAWCVALILTVLLSSHLGKFINYNTTALSNPSAASMPYQRGNMMMNSQVPQPAMNQPGNQQAMNQPADQTPVVSNVDAVKAAEFSTFITFVLFFLGALSSCIGGHMGFCACKDEVVVVDRTQPKL